MGVGVSVGIGVPDADGGVPGLPKGSGTLPATSSGAVAVSVRRAATFERANPRLVATMDSVAARLPLFRTASAPAAER